MSEGCSAINQVFGGEGGQRTSADFSSSPAFYATNGQFQAGDRVSGAVTLTVESGAGVVTLSDGQETKASIYVTEGNSETLNIDYVFPAANAGRFQIMFPVGSDMTAQYQVTCSPDTIPPDAPTIVSPAQGAEIESARPTFSGQAEARSRVHLSIDGEYTGSADADASGEWTFVPAVGLSSGEYALSIVAEDPAGNRSSAATRNFSIVALPPIAGPVSLTVPANDSPAPVLPELSGGEATSVAVASHPAHGSVAEEGLTLSYEPDAGYSGQDSFTYTARNDAGVSEPATVTVTVSAPILAFVPASGAALDPGTVGTAYAGQPVTVTEGGGSYTFTSSALPQGLTLDQNTGAIAGTPRQSGTFSVTLTAQDQWGATGSAEYSITIAVQAPTAAGSTATVAANSGASTIPLSLSGGPVTGIQITDQPGHGTAAVDGLTITYAPDAGYSGADSFTYTASNDSGPSEPATVSIEVTAPILTITPGTLPEGMDTLVYGPRTLTALLGTKPYSFEVTAGELPQGLTLSEAGEFSGTPDGFGTSSFTITATDRHGATGTAAYDLVIARKPATLVFSPAAGTLADAMAGEAYAASIEVDGGIEPYRFAIASGELPPGLVLDPSTGHLTGQLDQETDGQYVFTIGVQDGNGDPGSASYTLNVEERIISVTDKQVEVVQGTAPDDVDLTDGATGGPFERADIVSVMPANAGTATIVQAQQDSFGITGTQTYRLRFVPNPGYSGQAIVRFTLTSALGTSNTGSVLFGLSYHPADLARQVHEHIDSFTRSRAGMILSGIDLPTLADRRRAPFRANAASQQSEPQS